jgi:hypothetical protein
VHDIGILEERLWGALGSGLTPVKRRVPGRAPRWCNRGRLLLLLPALLLLGLYLLYPEQWSVVRCHPTCRLLTMLSRYILYGLKCSGQSCHDVNYGLDSREKLYLYLMLPDTGWRFLRLASSSSFHSSLSAGSEVISVPERSQNCFKKAHEDL